MFFLHSDRDCNQLANRVFRQLWSWSAGRLHWSSGSVSCCVRRWPYGLQWSPQCWRLRARSGSEPEQCSTVEPGPGPASELWQQRLFWLPGLVVRVSSIPEMRRRKSCEASFLSFIWPEGPGAWAHESASYRSRSPCGLRII